MSDEQTVQDDTVQDDTVQDDAVKTPAPERGSAEAIELQVEENIKSIYDPEIPVNIWDLGLIYAIEVSADRHVRVEMTLTSPMCPTAQSLVGQVEMAAKEVPFVMEAVVDLVWDPPWDLEKMSEEARLMLGF